MLSQAFARGEEYHVTLGLGLNRVVHLVSSLLLRIKDPRDASAWNRFVQLYAPFIHNYGRRKGLQDADAADLVQDVLQAVARSMDQFDYDTTNLLCG